MMYKKIVSPNFFGKLFLLLTIGFVFATAVGTVSHELGHYLAGKHYGYDPVLHYGSVSKNKPYGYTKDKFDSVYKADSIKIHAAVNTPQKARFLKYRASVAGKIKAEKISFTLWGPLQTMITGTLGFILLLSQRKKIREANHLTATNWILTILTFFWSRQLFNFTGWTINFLKTGEPGMQGDEARLSLLLLNLKEHGSYIGTGWFGLATALPALAILFYTIFRIIPQQHRLTFILAGLTGSIAGYILWFRLAGPFLLP